MAYKTILTNLPTPDRVKPVLDVAVPLARKHRAHLVGLHVVPVPHIYASAAAAMSASILDALETYYREQSEQVQEAFETRVQNEDIVTEWRSVSDYNLPVANVVISHGAAADLIIASQIPPDGDWEARSDLPIRLILESGRPVLIVPHAGGATEIGNFVTVAWNGSREAARAAFDALPLLQDAEQVKVLSLDPDPDVARASFTPSDAITLALVRQGVNAEAASGLSSGTSVGEALLTHVTQQGGDLLVMGCYGHARLHEFIFGGATRHILHNTTVPVLMSH